MPTPDIAPTAVLPRSTRSRADSVVVEGPAGSSVESAYGAEREETHRLPVKQARTNGYEPTYSFLSRRSEEKEMRLHVAAARMGEAYAELMANRNALVSKQFAGGLSKQESRKLELLRWKLDQIDDSRMGYSFERMSPLVEMHEQLAASVHGLVRRLGEFRPNAMIRPNAAVRPAALKGGRR